MPSDHVPVEAMLGERIARQGLARRDCGSVVAAAARTLAIQAQDAPASRLGIRARSAQVTEADVTAAVDTRAVVRTWLMRGTIHLVDTADLRWLVRLVGPSVQRRYRTRWRQLGLTDEVLDRCLQALPEILADRPLTRAEIRDALAERGITLDSPDPQAHTHAVLHASVVGLLCRAHDRGRDATFAVLDDWVPDAPDGPSGDDALAELARRYFAAFSPATAADFTTWSGMAGGRAIDLIRDELSPADVDGAPGFRLGEVEPQRGVRLLPAFDNYLIGYRDRRAILAAEHQPHVYQGGWIKPTVVHDGRVVGTWSLARSGRAAGRLAVMPFAPLPARLRDAVAREADDVGRFLDRTVTPEFTPVA